MQHPTDPAFVLAIRGTGRQPLRAALRRVAVTPELLRTLVRIVVLDAARAPALEEAARLPAGLLRAVSLPRATTAAALSRLLDEVVDEPATHVLVVDDVAVTDPAILLAALRRARDSVSAEVVGLRDAAAAAGPAGWWGAVLPLDAVRAIGAALPEAGAVALADLVLRADAAGFRAVERIAPGPVPVVSEVERLLLALLHRPVAARHEVLRGALRPGGADGLRALLAGPEGLLDGDRARSVAPRIHLWAVWPALRRRYRAGSMARSSAEAWSLRFLGTPVNRGWPAGEREEAVRRRADLRLRAWSATRRGTSAA